MTVDRLKKIKKITSGSTDKSAKVVDSLYAQIIDDNKGITICSASTLKSEKNKNSCNVANAKILGSELAKSAAEKGVKDVYLDRGSNLYHGIVKTVTDEVRSGGINL